MTTDATGTLDEAYGRLHATGPEFDGWLSNHGPMAAEAMVRHGHAGNVHRWLDGYMRRLEEFPRGTAPIGEDWREALGDPRRVADWTVCFRREVTGQPWRRVLGTWWPRLLPGVAAAATHGVIRVGHAVRALLEDGDDAVHVTELAHGVAYWAARWQPVPGAAGLRLPAAGGAPVPSAADALAAVPRIADQSGGVRERLGRLAGLPGWPAALAMPGIPASAAEIRIRPGRPGRRRDHQVPVLRARQRHHARALGHRSGRRLAHASCPGHPVVGAQPGRIVGGGRGADRGLRAGRAGRTHRPAGPASLPQPAEDTFARAVDHGDEHVIKFADTAADAYARTGNPDALAAAFRATDIIER